ncbi:hypothetical protein SAMD00019534_075560 [Acytostelium subglobosum LB1]|uniref:hypothetical protein n=1 Tax=Acytostelium subglobosum LB1 TaxID=1410327 RepID=UPI000644DA54|nr:hypothetical protein SAMD00019534_075560 [Acytostelium subglobosum LB1]GAM24381.1 hypothetical protein SAMD00019534_075560 [Acytostelium subglobosum LB1]|eukprot:XP_012752707.1 hypothetical protein SAMD00019534_075560 [Acytostelium subglobosum LB1]
MQYVNGLDIASETLEQIVQMDRAPDWDLIHPSPETTVYSREDRAGQLNFKSVGELDCPAEIIWNVLYRGELMEKWDNFCVRSKTLQQLDPLNFIDFMAFASPLGGIIRNFCLFKSCSMDLSNRRFIISYRSIYHRDAEREVAIVANGTTGTLSEALPCGFIIQEIKDTGRSSVSYITQISNSNLEVFSEESREYIRELYRKSGLHCLHRVNSLRKFMQQCVEHTRNEGTQLINQDRFFISTASVHLFKAVSETIAQLESASAAWNIFHQDKDEEFYFRETPANVRTRLGAITGEHLCLDVLGSGVIKIDATPEVIEAFVMATDESNDIHYRMVNQLSDQSSIVEIHSRSLHQALKDTPHLLVKQKQVLPYNITFIGFQSLDTLANSTKVWIQPSGYYIVPLAKGSCSLRYLINTTLKCSVNVSVDSIVETLSGRIKNTIHSFHEAIVRQSTPEDPMVDTSVDDEVLDLLYNIAIDEVNRNTHDSINHKRKYNDLESNNEESSIQANDLSLRSPLPFTPNWERFIKRKRFMLVRSQDNSLCTPSFYAGITFTLLPQEIIEHIFSYLDSQSLARVSSTCTLFNLTGNKNFLWRSLYDNTYSNSSSGSSAASDLECWRRLYMDRHCIYTNWRVARAKVTALSGHKTKITGIYMGQDMAITGSRDKEFQVWHLKSMAYSSIAKQSSCSVITFESGASDRRFIRAGHSNGLISHIDLEHRSISTDQRFVFLADGFIFDNHNVYIWETNAVQLWDGEYSTRTTKVSLDARAKINQARLGKNPNTLFTCCRDKTAKMWDLSAQPSAPSIVLQGHTTGVNCIDVYGEFNILTGSNDRSIRVWDIRKPSSAITVLKPPNNTSPIRFIKSVSNDRFVSGSDKMLHVWTTGGQGQGQGQSTTNDLFSSSILDNGHVNNMSAMAANDSMVISSFIDGVVKHYDFSRPTWRAQQAPTPAPAIP